MAQLDGGHGPLGNQEKPLLPETEACDSSDLRQCWGALGGSTGAESLLQVEDKIGERECRSHAGPDNDLSELFVHVEDALDHTHFKEDDGAGIAPAHPLGDEAAPCAAG